MVLYIEPELIKDTLVPETYFLFFLNLFLALFFTLAVFLANSRKGFIVTLGIIIFLILRLFGLGNLLNALLIIATIFSLEYYFTREK